MSFAFSLKLIKIKCLFWVKKSVLKNNCSYYLKILTAFDIFCSITTISMQLVRQYTSCIPDYFFRTTQYQQLVPPCTNRKSDFFIRHHHLLTDHNVINYSNDPPLLSVIMTNQQGIKYFYYLTRYLNVPLSYGIITVDMN